MFKIKSGNQNSYEMLALILIRFGIPSNCFVVIILVYHVYSITQLSGTKNISVFVLVRCQT